VTFLLPLETADQAVRPALEPAAKGARAGGTPFLSFFTPAALLALARNAGFAEARHIAADELTRRYFAGRTDGLRPPRHAEELLVARTRSCVSNPGRAQKLGLDAALTRD
jgi:hypothetical protein